MKVDLKEIIRIAEEAGQAILKIYNDPDFGVTEKADNSPLTLADTASNAVICSQLKSLYPEIPIISEENKTQPYSERNHYDYFWLVDPLDGTKEFIKRNGDFTVNIALVKGQIPLLGVLHVPCENKTYYSDKGKGAYIKTTEGTEPLTVQTFGLDEEGLAIVGSRSHMNEETETFMAKFNGASMVSRGSSLKFMMVAEGKAALYPRLAPTMEWDTCAAQAILEEAGGKVINHETNSPLLYNKEVLLNPWFVAYGDVKESLKSEV